MMVRLAVLQPPTHQADQYLRQMAARTLVYQLIRVQAKMHRLLAAQPMVPWLLLVQLLQGLVSKLLLLLAMRMLLRLLLLIPVSPAMHALSKPPMRLELS